MTRRGSRPDGTGAWMPNNPRRGSRVSLECSCEGRVVDWALTPWGDRLYAVRVLSKGERCRVQRHRAGIRISVRARLRTRPPKYYDALRG
jgi:hypothetical protein